jgi:pseudouridine kinase
MTEKPLDFLVFGAFHLDIKGKPLVRPALGESIPVITSSCPGGVAHNVAINLASVKARVGLCAMVGDDQEGHDLTLKLGRTSIESIEIMRSKRWPTAKYMALFDESGELFIAMADMNIYDELKSTLILPVLARHKEVAELIVDANLPEESIKKIAENKNPEAKLWGVGASAPKISRMRAGFPHWHGLFLNKAELFILSQKNDLVLGINTLAAWGISYLFVTAGKEGVYCWHGAKLMHFACPPTEVVDATGAGDAFCANVIFALSQKKSLTLAIEQGLSAARIALHSIKSSGK